MGKFQVRKETLIISEASAMKQATVHDCTDQPVYVGVDVSIKRWSVKIVGNGFERKPFSQIPSPQQLATHLRREYPNGDYIVAYEAGCTGFWTAHQLEALGIRCVVLHPADVPTTDKERQYKTDARDCTKIAYALRDNRLDTIHVPSAVTVDDRQLVRARSAFVRHQTRTKNQIKSLLAMHGLSTDGAPERQRWSRAYIDWLVNLVPERESLRHALDAYLEQLAMTRSSIAKTTRQIRTLAQTPRYARAVEIVDSVPGFHVTGAMIFLTEIEDIQHFRNVDHLASLVGLIPSTHSSGATDRVGQLSTRGRRQLRGLIVEAAWVAVRCDPELTATFDTLCARMKKSRAIVRIARKLLSRVHHLLRVDELYRINNALQREPIIEHAAA